MLSARPKVVLLLLLIVSLFACLAGLQPARAQNTSDTAVLLTATPSDPSMVGPLQITLNFPADGAATGYTISRKLVTDAAFTQLTSITTNAATTTSYVDRTVSVGIPYEYQVVRSANVTGTGYVVAGIDVPLPGATVSNPTAGGSRGTVVVVAASDAVADTRIATGLNRLTQDLVGDGWTVVSHSVARDGGMNAAGVMNDHGDAVLALKAQIRADYTADPTNVKAVLLFGHVPVPYSGDIAPDGHSNHQGAWPADVYYGDMGPETDWTDTSVNDQTADNPRTRNVPGDGKFDQGSIPGPIALEVGRVDLADLPAFAPKTEFDLLAQYLNKDHNYRTGFLTLNPVGRISDNFGYFGGEAFAGDGYRNFSAFFGPSAVTTSAGNDQIFPDLDLGNFQWTYGCGGGGPTGAGGVGSTNDFAANDPHSVFYMLFGSFFGDWGYGFDSGGNDFLRAPLATTTYGLTCSWAGRPHWFYQHMGLGSEIGFGARLTQNNGSVYQPSGAGAEGTHVALMGDPTLRETVVTPASGLQTVASGSDVAVSWVASDQAVNAPTQQANAQLTSPVIGYNVYRQDVANGPFTLLNTSALVTATTYTDTGVSGLPHTYQVRAVALQTSPTGTYYNQSQGVFQAYDSSHVAPTLTLVSPTKTVPGVIPGDKLINAPGVGFYATDANPVTLTIAAQATSSIPNDPGLSVTFLLNGVPIPGTGAQPNPATALPYQCPVTLKPGTYEISAIATDGQGATVASNELPVYVSKSDGDLNVYNGGLGTGWTDVSNKNNNAMTDNLGANPGTVNLNAPGSSLILSHVPIDTSLYPDLTLNLVLGGGVGNEPGGQQVTISAPLQDTAGVTPATVTLPGNGNNTGTIQIPLAGIVGAGGRGRNIDGLVIRATNGTPTATPTFYLYDIFLSSDGLRGNRAAGVAIHLDQAKYSVGNQPITAKGDASTPDGTVAEVDLFLSSDGGTTFNYIGRATGLGTTAAAPYSPYSSLLGTLAPSSYTLQARAITSFGTVSQSTSFTFTVVGLPTVAITAPANNAVFPTGSAFPITATATAATGANLTNVQFFYSLNGGAATEIGPDQTTGGPYQVSFTPPSVGNYVLTVVATDDAGGVATSAPVTVNVGDPPTVALTAPANGATFVSPATFAVTATATQGTNPISQVQFFANGTTLIGTVTAPTPAGSNTYTVNTNGLTAGTYALTAKVTDSIGLTAVSAPITVVVNDPPTVAITSPTNNSPFATGDTVTVTATATAGSNPITQVQFFAGTTSLGIVAAPGPYTVSTSTLAAGTYQLTAVVTDGAGLTATSAPVTIIVSAPPTVTLTAPANNATFVTGDTVTVTASPTAGSNSITKVDFFADGTLIGTATAAPYTVSTSSLAAGTHTLTAVVTDSIGLTATSQTVTIVVNAPPTVAITAPAGGTVFAAPATFAVTAAPAAGSNPITKVDFYVGGTLIGTATTAPYTISDANVPVGTYALTAVATDSIGLTATSAAVTVTVANAPTVAITAPSDGSTYTAPASFSVTATPTQGSNTISKVDFFSNGTLVGTATAAPYTVSLSGLAGGTYALTATVTDSVGLSATSAAVTVVVNTPPTVVITAPADGATFVAPATFSVSAAPTVGSNPITKVDFYANGTILIGTATAAPYTVSFASVAAGTYTLTAVATDSAGLTATSAAVTVVVNSGPSVTLTAPTNGATFVAPATFSVSAAATQGTSPITQVQFFAGGKPLGTATTGTNGIYTVSFANVAAGTYALTAIATDSAGLTATSQTVTVTVNSRPMVSISAPTGGTVFTAPATFDVTATTTAGSTPITKVDFFENGTLIGTATTAPYTVSFANVAAGSYGLTAVVTDGAGLTATSATVTVTVNAGPTVAITSPTDGSAFNAPSLIPITATATPGSNPISKVDFFANGLPIGTDATGTNGVYTVSFNGATAGTYVLTARATDQAGLTTTSAAVTITVSSAPTVAITSPTNGASFSAPATIPVTAKATAGSSPITQVQFFANGTTLIGTATTGTNGVYTVSLANVAAGTYSLTAKVTDSAGLTTTSAAVSITVVTPQPVYGLVSRSTDSTAVVGVTLRFTNQATGQVTTVTTGQSSTGPDGKSADYSLSSLASGTYTVAVSASGYVAPASQTVRVTAGQALRVDFTLSPLHAFPTGLQMFSVPYDYSASGQSLSAILGISNPRVVDYDPASASYTVPTTFVLGMGYWARFPAGAGLVIPGTPAPTSQPFTKTLPSGWNIIGDPFLVSEPWTKVQIVGANGTAVSLASAVSQRLIGANLYTYNQSTNAYNTIPVSTATGTLDPYQGYWIYANGSVTLKVTP